MPTPPETPATEVTPKARRRSFTAEYKRQFLRETDAATAPGAINALLRREGLFSSHLAEWRSARDRGELAGATVRRGPTPKVHDARDVRIAELERENLRLEARAERAEALIELQKKVAELLSAALPLPRAAPS